MRKTRLVAATFFGLFTLFFNIQCACAQDNTISGKILDNSSGEGLIGASVVIKETTIGSVTDLDGNFEFKTNREPPLDLVISFIGYLTTTYTLNSFDDKIKIELKSDQVLMDEVQIVGSRISEKQKMAALTTESMDVLAIKEAASGDFYESLGNLKGVDVTASSMGFKVINTRGFNSTSPVRSLQLIDGVDNQSPGLNFSLGNFLGTPDLDVMNVEIVAGASSAFFGPGAFNGVINMTSKSPWLFPGLAAEAKIGERNLNQIAVRWAQVIKNKEGQEKFAYKLNLFGMKANDWEAGNLDASTTSEDQPGNFAGYDAVNRYGDEVLAGGNDYSNNPVVFPGLGRIYRTGYLEKDIVDYNTNNFKGNVGLYYRVTEKIEVNYNFNYSTGTTVYQGDNRYSLKGIQFFQNKLQISQPEKFFIRAYMTHENAGNSYDAVVTAFEMSQAAKDESVFYRDYSQYYQNNIIPRMYANGMPDTRSDFPTRSDAEAACPGCSGEEVTSLLRLLREQWSNETQQLHSDWIEQNSDSMQVWHDETRTAADNLTASTSEQPFFEPGTERYDSLLADVTNRLFTEGGSRFYDKSSLYNIDGQYQFKLGNLGVTVGGNYRLYNPDSRGTIFADTLTYERTQVTEIDSIFIGDIFIGIDTTVSEVKVDSSYRKITNWRIGGYVGLNYKILQDRMVFDATLRVDKNENFDAVISPALSVVYNPAQEHTVRLTYSTAVRNPTMADQFLYYDVGRALLIGNLEGRDSLVTIESFQEALDGVPNFDGDKLVYYNVAPIKPEQVRTIELGYRGMLYDKFYVDLSYYRSWYTNFIGFNIGIDVGLSNSGLLTGAQAYRIAANATDQVTTQGFTIGANYYLGNNWVINANYSWNELDLKGSDDPIVPAFNTPEHKYNIGINGRDFTFFGLRYFGFGVNYKWIQGFEFEGSPQFTGFIDSYGLVDAQVNYRWQKLNLTFKLGASNLLNNEVYQVYGGPLIGRLAYFSISYDWVNR